MNNDQDAAMLKEGTVIGKKTYMRLYEGTTDFWKGRKRGTCKFLSISMLLDPDPHSPIRIRILISLRIRIQDS
jgi:hypothetical protein